MSGVYRGIPLSTWTRESANVAPRRFADLAAESGLYLHAHADAPAVAELLALRSDARVPLGACRQCWPGHHRRAARPAPAALGRACAAGTDAVPGWPGRSLACILFARYPDRFMIGTDTWITPRWAQLPRLMADVRVWLRQLPRDLAERIAS